MKIVWWICHSPLPKNQFVIFRGVRIWEAIYFTLWKNYSFPIFLVDIWAEGWSHCLFVCVFACVWQSVFVCAHVWELHLPFLKSFCLHFHLPFFSHLFSFSPTPSDICIPCCLLNTRSSPFSVRCSPLWTIHTKNSALIRLLGIYLNVSCKCKNMFSPASLMKHTP